jgi:hypothetical protein
MEDRTTGGRIGRLFYARIPTIQRLCFCKTKQGGNAMTTQGIDLKAENERLQQELQKEKTHSSELESLLSNCLSTMDNIHGYDYDSYQEARNYLYGDDDE